MSASTLAHPERTGGRTVRLWLAFIVIIAAGIGLAWIGAGAMRPEVSSTGLEFRTLKGGSGEPIGPNDAAVLDYAGQLDDGTVFDNSEAHGGPQPFTVGAVFPGFGEAMLKMREGGRYRFKMPPRLAFGDRPPPQGFPPNSSLTFEVQVRKIVRGGAAMVQSAPPAQQ